MPCLHGQPTASREICTIHSIKRLQDMHSRWDMHRRWDMRNRWDMRRQWGMHSMFLLRLHDLRLQLPEQGLRSLQDIHRRLPWGTACLKDMILNFRDL